jgi:hypothetical protein
MYFRCVDPARDDPFVPHLDVDVGDGTLHGFVFHIGYFAYARIGVHIPLRLDHKRAVAILLEYINTAAVGAADLRVTLDSDTHSVVIVASDGMFTFMAGDAPAHTPITVLPVSVSIPMAACRDALRRLVT